MTVTLPPWYADDAVTVWHGDCLHVMADMPDNSVDAVVTDPPYGLEFMGKEWDSPGRMPGSAPMLHGGWTRGPGGHTEGYRQMRNNMAAYQDWCQQWATQCLRVLKPGGHMLAFGGTRTWHRLTCAIEDAGFEIRDTVADLTGIDGPALLWMYSSGFPKSLNVSRAIDLTRRRDYIAAALRLGMKIPARNVDDWTKEGHAPSDRWWEAFKETLSPDHWGAIEREVIGSGKSGAATIAYPRDTAGDYSVTAPASPEAAQWAGWGTALKPSFEPIIVGRKPAGHAAILAEIGSHLDQLEQTWQAPATDLTTPTGAAADSYAATDTSPSESTAATNSNTVSSWRQCWAVLYGETNTSTTGTTSSTTTDLTTLSSCLAAITDGNIPGNLTTPSGLTPLASAVDSLFAAAVMKSNATRALSATGTVTDDTLPSRRDEDGTASPSWEPIIVARKPLQGTVAANVLRWGTGGLNIDATRIGTDDRWKASGVQSAAGSSYAGSVDGSLNVSVSSTHDAGRWPPNAVLGPAAAHQLDQQTGNRPSAGIYDKGSVSVGAKNGAASIPLDGVAAPQYGDSGGGSRFFPVFRYEPKAPGHERPRGEQPNTLNSAFGAAQRRCELCGKQAVSGGLGGQCQCENPRWGPPQTAAATSHPTVKPLDLIRWLCTMVCPPGGTILDPFAGSGTTGEAAIIEGFRAILIERETDYLPMIRARLSKPIQPVLDW